MTDPQPPAGQTITDPLWAGPRLFIPVAVECLMIGQPNQTGSWAALDVDYRQVPNYADPAPQPFQLRPPGAPPGTGAHLQATLPSCFRSGQQMPEGTVEFPPIPNRWMIARSVVAKPGAAPTITIWVLQGDFLGDQTQGTNSYPDPTQVGVTKWIGQAFTIESWQNPDGPGTPILRSMGPGDVSWIATTDNTMNVLSFYDSLEDVDSGSVAYAMNGWYHPASFDPLLGVTDADPKGFTTADQWQTIMSTLGLEVGGSHGLADAQAAWSAWSEVNPITGGPPLLDIQKEYASQSLVHGMVYGIDWKGPAANYPRAPILSGSNPVSVAVGGNGVEAIAAWMATVLDNPDVEDLILAVQQDLAYDYLQQPSIFETRSQDNRFTKLEGGTIWVVAQPDNSDADRGETLQMVKLSPDQTSALTTLNEAQATLDSTTRRIDSNVAELFALCWKQKQLSPFSSDKGSVDAAITATKNILSQLSADKATQQTAVDNAKTALLGLLGNKYVLTANGAQRFTAPSSVTVMVAGGQTDTRMLPVGEDGTDSEALFCRFTGQTVSALTVVVPADNSIQTITTEDLVTSIPTLPAYNSGLPKELRDYLVETVLFDTANARLLASIAYQKAGITPTAAQLDTLAANIQVQQTAPWTADSSTTYDEQTAGEAVGFIGVVPMKRSVLDWTPAWTPLFIDWEVEWVPTAATAAKMMDQWHLDGFEFSWTGTTIGNPSETFSGRSVLGTQIAAGLAAKLSSFVNDNPNLEQLPDYQVKLLKEAAADIAKYDIITEAMNGFGPTMLMLEEMITQLTNSDPEIEAWLRQAPSVVPQPNNPPYFYPLRGGHLTITRLWVVDAFGQILRTTNPGQDVLPIRSTSVTTPDKDNQDFSRYVQVAPAVQQSMRVQFNLLDANDDSILTNSSSLTNPVCGWVLPNHLDHSLQVFATDGTPLGEVLPVETDLGNSLRWDPAPGHNVPLGQPPAIDNVHLKGFIDGLLAQALVSGDQALTDLLDVIDTTLWKSAQQLPPGSNLEVLIGKPVAVVRADLSLLLNGNPAVDQSWAQTGKNNDGGITQVPFTTYVGDMDYEGNGALGYFLNDDYSVLNPLRGYTPSMATMRRAVSAPAGRPRINVSRALTRMRSAASAPAAQAASAGTGGGSGYVAVDPSVTLLADGPGHKLTVLMDPQGVVPVVSGIVPVVIMPLPQGSVAGMETLLATFRMGPILVDPRRVQMPLPADVSGTWSWIARTGVSMWENVGNLNPNNQPQALLPANPPDLREGWLGLVPKPPASGTSAASVQGGAPESGSPIASMEFTERPRSMTTIAPKAAAEAITPTTYKYQFQPDTLIIGATAAPTLIITNPSPQTSGGSGTQTIYVSLPVGNDANDITNTLGGVSYTPSDNTWLATSYPNSNPPYLKLVGPALDPLKSLAIYIQNLQVSDKVGTAAFAITEDFSGGSTAVTITKTAAPLNIDQFYASPITVTQGDTTTLNWTVEGGSYVLINPGNIRRSVTGKGKFTDSVAIPVQAPSTTYTLQLYTDDRQFKQTLAVAYVGSVQASLSASDTGPIDTDTPITLSWTSTYAIAPLRLAPPYGPVPVDLNSSRQVTPGDYLSGNQSSVTFTLQAMGYNGPVSPTVTVTLNPVRIRWFRYTDASKTQVTSSVVNPAPGSPSVSSQGGDQVLTAYGPHAGSGPLKAYLGPGTHLQVQLMDVSPSPAKPGETVTVTYETLNAETATLATSLRGTPTQVPLDTAKQTGATTITAPDGDTTLVLTVTSNGQNPVTSEYDLVIHSDIEG